MAAKTRGKFIVIDGADGSGIPTVIEHLKSVYSKDFLFTREPGGSPFAEKIREIILSPAAKEASGLTQFGLFWAARADHLEKKIKPALAQGINVVSDRFDSSSYAFQIHGQQMFPLEKIFMQMREICLAETKPDLYLILDVNPHISVSRMFGRGKAGRNHFDERDVEFHRRVRAAFRNLPAEFPKVVISSHDPVEEVKTRVKAVVDSVLKGEQGQLFDLL